MTEPRNLLSAVPSELTAEVSETLVAGSGIRIERIVSQGQSSPQGFWYDQEETEWVLLICGRARLRFADRDQPLDLQPGDHVEIPAHSRHRVDWTDPRQPTIWLAVFYR